MYDISVLMCNKKFKKKKTSHQIEEQSTEKKEEREIVYKLTFST